MKLTLLTLLTVLSIAACSEPVDLQKSKIESSMIAYAKVKLDTRQQLYIESQMPLANLPGMFPNEEEKLKHIEDIKQMAEMMNIQDLSISVLSYNCSPDGEAVIKTCEVSWKQGGNVMGIYSSKDVVKTLEFEVNDGNWVLLTDIL